MLEQQIIVKTNQRMNICQNALRMSVFGSYFPK